MTAALESLTITAFRGSSQTFTLDFERNRTLSLIYGENGTGKTTICDALEFLAVEKLGSLEERGLGGALHRFWHSAGRQPGETRVELKTSSGVCTGRIDGAKASVTPAYTRPRVEVLRRQQVLNLIEAAPAARYEAIKRFIEIDAFERSERALKELSGSLADEKKAANAALLGSLSTLDNFRTSAGGGVGDVVVWAKAEVALPTEDRKSDIARLEALRGSLQTLQGYPAKFEGANAKVQAATSKLATARQVHSAATAVAAADTAETIDVLEAGRALLIKTPAPEACPMCESAQNVAALSERLDERLRSLRGFQATLAEVGRQEAAAREAGNARTSLLDEYRDMAVRFNEARAAAGDLAPENPVMAAPDDPDALAAWLGALLPHDEARAGRQATWRQQGQLHETLRKQVEACEQNRDKLAELERLTPLAEQVLKLLVAERQAFTSRIIGEIAEEVGRLYEAVHPGEGLDKISLPLDPKKRASLGLQASFGDGEAPPQAYFSQSHLDTLGLCVFLALALRERASETILILDDVLGSVDEPHVERVIEMVYEVSTRFRHTIVTTHYRPWRVKFNWGELRPGKPVNVVDLTSWNLERGIQVTKCIPEVDRLAALLSAAPQDMQAITSKAGVILEQALDHLTRKYECRMPRHDRGYTLGDLLDAVSGKLRTALKIERRTGDDKVEIVELGPILDRLKSLSASRNVLGAHFNVLAQQLTGREGVEFAEQVLRLADALVCPEHGWPTNDESGSYWKNSGDTRRLHPLKTPG